MWTVSEDLLHELLSLLPSIDLLRFRCVSKSWRAIIDSQYFIQLHLNKSLKDIKSRKVLAVDSKYCSWRGMEKMKFYAIGFDSEFKITVPREIKSPIKGNYKLGYTVSCKSLICLEFMGPGSNNDKIVLWNPSVRSHRILPFAPVEIEDTWSRWDYTCYYAFRYDEFEDDYKVVRLTVGEKNYDYEVKVYSLKFDTWKEIEKIPLPVSKISRPIHANDAIIWLLEEKKPCFRGWPVDAEFSLLVLPLRTEVLHLVTLPESLNELGFELRCCFSSNLRDFRNCDCGFRNLLKLINNKKSGTLISLLLQDSDINGRMNYLNDPLHERLCSNLRSLGGNLYSKEKLWIFLEDPCLWVDSLFRVERSNNKSKIRRAHQLVETEAQGEEDYKRQK